MPIRDQCLVCNTIADVSKMSNVQRHFMTMHKLYLRKFTENSVRRRNKAEDLQRNLRSPRTVFSESPLIKKARMVVIASYTLTEILDRKKSFWYIAVLCAVN